MDFSQGSFISMLLLSAFLGAKHGYDPDHLATIDALTRLGRGKSRAYAGALFSLGHGFVVLAVALSIAWLGRSWNVPYWFETAGLVTSVSLLLILGSMNLWALLSTPKDVQIGMQGPRAHLMTRIHTYRSKNSVFTDFSSPVRFVVDLPLPWDSLVPFLVGGLFALSFDTLSQAVLFSSITAAQSNLNPMVAAAGLGCAFTFGMLISDGLNGWFIASLVQRGDKTGAAASRFMCMAVVAISYGIAGLATIKLLQSQHWHLVTQIDAWYVSIAITLLLLASFAYGQWNKSGDRQ